MNFTGLYANPVKPMTLSDRAFATLGGMLGGVLTAVAAGLIVRFKPPRVH